MTFVRLLRSCFAEGGLWNDQGAPAWKPSRRDRSGLWSVLRKPNPPPDSRPVVASEPQSASRKYRDLRAECKRWRNQAAAVEKSRTLWRQRAEAQAAALQDEQAARAALATQLQDLHEQTATREAELATQRAQRAVSEGAEKGGAESTGRPQRRGGWRAALTWLFRPRT